MSICKSKDYHAPVHCCFLDDLTLTTLLLSMLPAEVVDGSQDATVAGATTFLCFWK